MQHCYSWALVSFKKLTIFPGAPVTFIDFNTNGFQHCHGHTHALDATLDGDVPDGAAKGR